VNAWARTAVVLLLLVLTSGLGQGTAPARTDAPSRTAGPRGTTRERVRIVDFAFRPRTLQISRGTRVRWVNRGSVAHTTTSDRDLWDSGRLAPGDSFSRVFRRSGTFRYHCSIHSSMTGRIVVG
jgi:plastocyanin